LNIMEQKKKEIKHLSKLISSNQNF